MGGFDPYYTIPGQHYLTMVTPTNSGVRKWLSQDVISAVLLLIVCAVFWVASLQIREPDYGQLSPATWPRIIIGVMTLLCVIYLVQSVRAQQREHSTGDTHAPDTAGELSAKATNSDTAATTSETSRSPSPLQFGAFYRYWKNVFWCFLLFGLYLWSLPWLGMLVGACLFVFLLLTALGGWRPKQLLLHSAIALLTVGGMWSLFTFGLGVILPPGSLFDFR